MSKSSKKIPMVKIPTHEYRYLVSNAFRACRVGDWLLDQNGDFADIKPVRALYSDKLSIESILDDGEDL